MFPNIAFSVAGLDKNSMYTVTLQVQPVDDNRYKFEHGKWKIVGKGVTHDESRMKFVHPDSSATGERWMANEITFKKTKLTNAKTSKANFVSSVRCIFVQLSIHSYVYTPATSFLF